ncbi:MAG TPA: extracellular solute-binding protein [Chloroflexota bacterium]|nr:extracellular solute-binding protein [Chloroflexota bacterium]
MTTDRARGAMVSRRGLIRGLGLGVAAGVVGSLLAACGGGAPPSPTAAAGGAAATPTPAPAAPTSAPAAQPTPAAQAAPASGAAVTIVVWAGSLAQTDTSKPGGQWAKWVIDHFQEKNPGITVKAEDHGWDQALRTALLTAIAGGTVPEITTGEAFVHEFASLGAFADLRGAGVQADMFAPGPVKGSIFKGKLYGVPIFTSPFALETNVRVAEKAGLDPQSPPKSWDELVANAQKAYKAGQAADQKFVGFNLYGPAPNRIYGCVLRTLPWINQTGHPLGDDDGTKAFMNDPGALPAYELSRNLFKTADPGNTFSGDEGKLYAYLWQDKAVYQASATWNVYNAIDAKAECVYHPLPRKDPNVSGNVVLGNEVYSPLAKAKNLEAALKFEAFMAEEETQKQVGNILGQRLPTLKSLLQDPNLTKLPAYTSYQGVSIENAMRTFADILVKEDVHPVPPYAKNPDKIWIAWGDAFGKILQSNGAIKPILDELQANVEKLLG